MNEYMNQSINQSKRIIIAPYVANESEAHGGTVAQEGSGRLLVAIEQLLLRILDYYP